MPVIDAQTLFSESKCYNCYGELTTGENIILALWRRVVLSIDPTADVSPQGLVAYSKCYLCFTEGSMFDAMEMAMMNMVSSASACGTPTSTIAFATTPLDPDISGNYQQTSATTWQQVSPVVHYGIRLVSGVWELFDLAGPATIFYTIAEASFPCGDWTPNPPFGIDPATAHYS